MRKSKKTTKPSGKLVNDDFNLSKIVMPSARESVVERQCLTIRIVQQSREGVPGVHSRSAASQRKIRF